jgi:hypothetical protein
MPVTTDELAQKWLDGSPAFNVVLSNASKARRTLRWVDALHSRAEAADTFDRLLANLRAQTKAANIESLGAEFAAAYWLSETGLLVSEGPKGGDPVIDFLARTSCEEIGVEVKHDFEDTTRWLLDPQHEHDQHALGPLIRKICDTNVVVAIDWATQPNRTVLGPQRLRIAERIRTELRNELNEYPALPDSFSISIEILINGPIQQRMFVRVKKMVAIGMNLFQVGEGWGIAADRIVNHATAKASKSPSPFVLVYVSGTGLEQAVDPDRLSWAAAEISQRAPAALRGVVCLRSSIDVAPEFVAHAWYRDGSERLREIFSSAELPPADYRRSAKFLYELLSRDIARGVAMSVGYESHTKWLRLASCSREVDETMAAAQELLVDAMVLMSNETPFFKSTLRNWVSLTRPTFPASSSQLIEANIDPPRR